MHLGQHQSSIQRLADSLEVLQGVWGRVREEWRDERGQQFEAEEWPRLQEAVKRAIPAIARLSEVMMAAQRECEDSNR